MCRSRCVGAVVADGPGTAVARGVRMTLGNSLVSAVLIVRAVSREGRQGIYELVEQRVSSRGVVALFLGQLDRDNFAALAIDADMQFTPRSAAGRAVLFNQPFA